MTENMGAQALATELADAAEAAGAPVGFSPRGIGAVVSMIVVGRLVGKIDGRYLVMFGFVVVGYSSYLLGDINLDISISSIVWPQIIAGLAMGFVFVPLTVMATGTLSNEQIGNATGIFNLMRNVGGSFGIAAVTTMLARGAQVHQSAMVSHLTPFDPAFQQRVSELAGVLGGPGSLLLAQQQAYGAIYQTLVRQANLLASIDNFRFLAFMCVICAPAALLFKRVRNGRQAPAIH
jgi:DHA2 family multidrug resistance protein